MDRTPVTTTIVIEEDGDEAKVSITREPVGTNTAEDLQALMAAMMVAQEAIKSYGKGKN